MKYKITARLISYFSAVLILFSIIVGIMFQTLFTRHTAKIHEQDLKVRATTIADSLSQFQNNNKGMNGNGNCMEMGLGMGNGYGAYLRFIDEIAMSEVWLVDEQAQTIQMGHMGSSLSYQELPDSAEYLIQQVFHGNVESNREFSSVLGVPTVTVGAPVRNAEGNITAALLLHSPVNGMDQAQKDGLVILLLCILTALFLAIILSILLARRFIRPLQKMKSATEQIIQGDYLVHTGISQNDEIGLLAEHIDQLSQELSKIESERKELDKMRQDFISNISHELRTPVTVIKGSLEVLGEGLITDPQEIGAYIQQMQNDINQLQRLINDLLELSRLQNVKFEIEMKKLNLTEVIEEVIKSMNRVGIQKQISISFYNESGSFLFYGDYGRLRQMFTIILDNAIKFSIEGSGITVRMQKTADGCSVFICDQGSGIPIDDIPHIFEQFYRERTQHNKSGSGLGLSIAKQIADRHNITISCESEVGKETCFCFCIHKDISIIES